MNKLLSVLVLLCLGKSLHAQQPYVYTIKADSVKITNTCDTAELIIENHTQNVPGFLFNKGRGRTEFRRVLSKVDDSIYLIGIDTLRLSGAWLQGGNRFGSTGKFGTLDNNHIDFYTNNMQRGRWTSAGNLLLGATTDNGLKLQVNGGISLVNGNDDIRSTRFPVLIGDEGTGGGIGFLFDGDATARLIRIGGGHSNNFHKFQFQSAGQSGDSSANYNFIYNGNAAHALNIFNFADGHTKLLLSAPGNLLLNSTADNGAKLQVNGSSYFHGSQIITGTTLAANGGTHTSFIPTVTSTGTDWDYLSGMRFSPTINFSANNQQGSGLYIEPIFNLNGTSQYPDAISSALQVSSTLGGIKINQAASTPGTSGQPLFIEQNGTSNKEIIHNYRNHTLSTKPFIWNHDTRPVGNRESIVPALRSTIANVEAGGGISFTMDRYYWGTEAAMEMKYETTPAEDTGAYKNTSIAFKTMSAGVGYTSLYLYGNNAGLGTTTPSAQLHTTGTVRFGGLTNDNSLTRIVVSDANGNLYYRDASSLAFNETLNSDLAVNGRVSAQMIITQTGRWPDYVFSKQYSLPSLLEVENFIKQNSHLPGIPSAAEVGKKGIDVAGNQAALLQKIEELTLYIIGQDKTIQKQSDQIKELLNLKQEMAELRALIKK